MTTPALTISNLVHRRFIIGRAGLWPGRRWRGLDGVVSAITAAEALQLDPLNIVARSQDIALYGRVLDYSPSLLDTACYEQRRFFDYGGCLFLYPMHEFPYWRVPMSRDEVYTRWAAFKQQHPDTPAAVLQALQENGPLGNRQFEGNHRVVSYRGRKDTALALYYLWLTGEVMIHHRENFQRFYHLRGKVLPPHLDYAADPAEAEAFFARKAISFAGLARLTNWRVGISDYLNRTITRPEAEAWLERLVEDGAAIRVQVEGEKELRYALSAEQPVLEKLVSGSIPPEWQPLDTTTEEEVTFLAPLEISTARGRAARLFGFDYVWEVYKPVEQRRWGYYVLPILWGDRLVGRLDPRLERDSLTLRILGFWLEDPALADNPAFASAFQRGLGRFMRFMGAQALELPASMPGPLNKTP